MAVFALVTKENITSLIAEKAGVYVLKCLENRKYYVGQSVNIRARVRVHLFSQRLNKNGGSFEMGVLSEKRNYRFEIQVFYIDNQIERDDRERELIKYFGERYELFNRIRGKHGSLPKRKHHADDSLSLSRIKARHISVGTRRASKVYSRTFRFKGQTYTLGNIEIANLLGIKRRRLEKLLYEQKLDIQTIANKYDDTLPKSERVTAYQIFEFTFCDKHYEMTSKEFLRFFHTGYHTFHDKLNAGLTVQEIVDSYNGIIPEKEITETFNFSYLGKPYAMRISKLAQFLHMHKKRLRNELLLGVPVQTIVDQQMFKLSKSGGAGRYECQVMIDGEKVFMSVSKTAEFLNISRRKLYKLIADNKPVQGVLSYGKISDFNC